MSRKLVGGYQIKPRQEARYFESDLLEKFSKCPFWLPLLIWVPIVVGLLVLSQTETALSAGAVIGLAFGGLFFWSFAEYWLHRKFFHWRRFKRFHFFLHGSHHEYPDDLGRLVFPPTASLTLGAVIFLLCWAILGLQATLPFFAGFAVGYLWYDMTHYWTHVGKPRSRYGKLLRRHHMLHHYSAPGTKFGVSSPLWDFVFRTYGEPATKTTRATQSMEA